MNEPFAHSGTAITRCDDVVVCREYVGLAVRLAPLRPRVIFCVDGIVRVFVDSVNFERVFNTWISGVLGFSFGFGFGLLCCVLRC